LPFVYIKMTSRQHWLVIHFQLEFLDRLFTENPCHLMDIVSRLILTNSGAIFSYFMTPSKMNGSFYNKNVPSLQQLKFQVFNKGTC
jgi:hypothetical protein